jgi:hypothetical protein
VPENVELDDIPIRLRELGDGFSQRVSGFDDDVLRRRPSREVWSPLEYLCHVRDVFLIQRDRAVLALIEDRPSFPRMYRDERVEVLRYAEQSPGEVGHRELDVAAILVGRVFSELSAEEWQRPLIYNYPEPAEHDLAWLARHTVHEGEHHLFDIDWILDRESRHR